MCAHFLSSTEAWCCCWLLSHVSSPVGPILVQFVHLSATADFIDKGAQRRVVALAEISDFVSCYVNSLTG